jgi:hypothetical protein
MAAQLAGGVTAVRDLGDARWAVADRHRGAVAGPPWSPRVRPSPHRAVTARAWAARPAGGRPCAGRCATGASTASTSSRS